MSILSYNNSRVLNIPLSDKFLLTLKFDKDSIKVAEQPFAMLFDDQRNLYFSYVLDFTGSSQSVLSFPRLSRLLLERQNTLKMFFNVMSAPETHGESVIKFIKEKNLILSLIKEQVSYYDEEKTATIKNPVLYNPTAFVPFVPKSEREEIINYCRDNLINLVVFDSLNNSVSEVEEKGFLKSTKKLVITTNPEEHNTSDAYWDRLHTEGFLDLKTYLLMHDPSKALKTTYLENSNFESAAHVLKPWFEKCNLNHIKTEKPETQMDFLKLYFAVRSNLNPLESLYHNNFFIREADILSLLDYLRKQHFLGPLRVSSIESFARHLLGQWGSEDEVFGFFQKILPYHLNQDFTSSQSFLFDSSSIKIKQFIELSNKLKISYPQVWNKLAAWFQPQVENNSESAKLLTRLLESGSVKEIEVLVSLYSLLPVYATSLIKNPKRVQVIQALGIDRVIAVNKIFSYLTFDELESLLETPTQDIPLRVHFKKEIGALLNSKSTLTQRELDYIFTHGPEKIEADSYAVNVTLAGYALPDTLTRVLKETMQNPRLTIKRQTWEFIRLKLYKRGIIFDIPA